MGRPSDYTQELADEICAELAAGKSMRTVCKPDAMPSRQTLFSWMRLYPQFLDQYARAKEESADALFDDIQDISDNGTNDYMEAHDPANEGYKLNGEHIQRSKLRVDTRKWMASKMKPKKYGDRQTVEHEVVGEGAEAILNAAIERAASAKP